MAFHLAERADDLVTAGMHADEARRRFGSYALQKEDTRARDLLVWRETLAADVRYALRGLRAAPGFAPDRSNARERVTNVGLWLGVSLLPSRFLLARLDRPQFRVPIRRPALLR